MADKKQNLLGLLKQLEGTINAAGLSAVTSKGANGLELIQSDETRDVIRLTGDNGSIRLEYSENSLEILGAKDEDDFNNLGTLLFEAESDDWTPKDIRSAANEVAETISDFLGTTFVTAGSSEKAQKKQAAAVATASKQAKPAPKKKKKKSADSYEPIDLMYRLEAIYPDYAGKADENEAKYGTFLPEEYLQDNDVVSDVLVDIRMEDRTQCKKLFKTFNTYYDDGEKDTQSLIAVSILGIGASKEDGLMTVMENYMSDDLKTAVSGVVRYLKSGAGKRALKKYADPKPYKESLKEKWGKQGLQNADLSKNMLDSSSLNK